MNAAVQNGFDSLAGFVQSQPDLNFRIPSGRGASSWLLNTYLDKVASSAHSLLASFRALSGCSWQQYCMTAPSLDAPAGLMRHRRALHAQQGG